MDGGGGDDDDDSLIANDCPVEQLRYGECAGLTSAAADKDKSN